MIKKTVKIQCYNSPCGKLVLGAVDNTLCLCDWQGMPCADRNKRRLARLINAEFSVAPSPVLDRAKKELDEYFCGNRKSFDIPIRAIGTDFQKRVWQALLEIPYGETRSYKEIALKANCPEGARAVAGAVGANAISILIPCHRIIGANGSLTGFAGGIEAKRLLLGIESKNISGWEL